MAHLVSHCLYRGKLRAETHTHAHNNKTIDFIIANEVRVLLGCVVVSEATQQKKTALFGKQKIA